MRYELKTAFNKDQIDQTLLRHDDLSKTVDQVSREVISLKEQGVIDALIKLGWTPPKQN